ncbi:MAG: DegT/DnrJ/EryC1/StrS family aminotransferase, partial [Gammaproteobacteria bacterium]
MTQGLPIQFIDLAAQQQRLGPGIQAAMARVLAHGNYILGPEVKELEQKLAEFSGARHVVSCASGTDALLMVLMAKGVQAGEAVFMPSFSFVSTAEVVALLGATPVFVDVEAEDFLMSPTSLEAAIQDALKKGLRPKVVIPVDLFGQPADYAAIGKLAKNYDLFVLADGAQSFGGARGDKRVGTLAPVTATSFFPAKPLGCYGDGGAIFTDDEALAQVLLSLRVHGQGQDKYDNVRIGINGRLDTLQAAILIEKLRLFPEEIEARQRVAARYTDGLEDIVKTPRVVPGTISAWAQYTLRLDGRDAVAARLKERGVPTAVYYPKPLHQQTAYTRFPTAPGGLP